MKNKAFAVQLVSLLFVFLIVLLFPRFYAERDDVGFVYLFEHHYFAPFIHPALSHFFHSLYRLALLPWYSLYHYLLLAVILGMVLNIITSLKISTWLRWGFALVTCIVFTNFVCRITFTYTAILLQGVSLFSFFNAIAHSQKIQGQDKNKPLIASFAYGALFALAYMTRTESIGAFLFIVPPTLWLAWKLAGQIPPKRLLLNSALFVSPLLVAFLATPFFYSGITPDERLYVQETSALANTIGFAYTEPIRKLQILEKIGWTLTDYQMFSKWLFVDEHRFSMSNIERMSQYTWPMISQVTTEFLQPARFFEVAYEVLSRCWINQGKLSFYLLGILMLGLVLLSSIRQKTLLLLYAFYCFTGSVLLYEYLRLPDRVSAPVYFIAAVGLIVIFKLSDTGPVEKKLQKAVVLAGVGLLLTSNLITFYKNAALPSKAKKPLETIQYLEALQADSYILRTGDPVSTQWIDPLKVRPLRWPDIGPGWFIFSPAFYDRLHQLGLRQGSDILPWMINNPKACLVMKKKDKSIVEDFILQTYHIQAQAVPAAHLPSNPNSVVFKLVKSSQ